VRQGLGHALTGSFTLDVSGGQPEWGRNFEAAQSLGAELERVVDEAADKLKDEANVEFVEGLTPTQ
jgi:hypothetical protein